MNKDAIKRLKAAEGNHFAAVQTAVRGLARAASTAAWLRSPTTGYAATEADRVEADAKVAQLTTTVAELVLDAPQGTFSAQQVAMARRTVAS